MTIFRLYIRNISFYLFAWLLLFGCVAGDDENNTNVPANNQPITYSARKGSVITRAGDSYSAFASGTLYRLYALDCAALPNYWDSNNGILYGNIGEELNGAIAYTVEDNQIPYFNDRTLDFYGVTYGTTTAPAEVAPATTPPRFELTVDAGGNLPDLLRAYLPNRVSSQGRVVLDFKHTLSKLRFEIGQQAVAGSSRFEGVHIERITLKNTYLSGKLNLQSGDYEKNTPTGDTERVFYSRNSGTKVPVEATPHRFESELLLFPREADDPLGLIELEVVLGKDGNNNWKTVMCPLKYAKVDANGDPVMEGGQPVYENYSFKGNYDYLITLMLMDEDVKLIVFSPQVYEWIDVDASEEESQEFMGRPITFAGLMWMDRNLGAKSADCYNNWDDTRGYYYQFGRSIPYMLDESKWTNTSTATFNHLYTIDNNGNRIYGRVYPSSAWTPTQVAWKPGDIPVDPIAPYTGYEYMHTSTADPSYWILSTLPNTYWDDIENQPCPKGWRVPTDKDYASFLPDPYISVGIENASIRDFNKTNVVGSGQEDRIVGKLNSVLSIYLLKNKGRDDCYRIRIRRLNSKESAKKQYFEVNRYPAEKNWSFDSATISDIETLFDWSIPTEQFLIPAVGFVTYLTSNPFYGDGELTVLRSSTFIKQSFSRVCYFRTDAVGFGLFDGHNHGCADQIRCVRDLN